jgi:protein-disulfide isomerase
MNLARPHQTMSRGLAAGAILAIFGLGTLPACSAQDAGAKAAQPAAKNTATTAVAEIDGKAVTMAELEKKASRELKQLDSQRQQILEGTLNALVEDKLIEAEAAKRGTTSEALLKAEVEGKIAPVTDADVDTWYEQNKARINVPKEQVIDRIKAFLAQQRSQEARTTFLTALRQSHNVKILLEPPRAEVDIAGAPVKGSANAKVTIVEFSDFECPFCSRVLPTMKKVEEVYGDKVRVAFRQFPLESIHPNARKAAQASLCAHDQGKFWEMHDALFAKQKELAVGQLKGHAVALGLDAEKFNTCLDSNKYDKQVTADLEAGQAAGVSGTPALFVNGRLVAGAVPFEEMAKIIDDELGRAR